MCISNRLFTQFVEHICLLYPFVYVVPCPISLSLSHSHSLYAPCLLCVYIFLWSQEAQPFCCICIWMEHRIRNNIKKVSNVHITAHSMYSRLTITLYWDARECIHTRVCITKLRSNEREREWGREWERAQEGKLTVLSYLRHKIEHIVKTWNYLQVFCLFSFRFVLVQIRFDAIQVFIIISVQYLWMYA